MTTIAAPTPGPSPGGPGCGGADPADGAPTPPADGDVRRFADALGGQGERWGRGDAAPSSRDDQAGGEPAADSAEREGQTDSEEAAARGPFDLFRRRSGPSGDGAPGDGTPGDGGGGGQSVLTPAVLPAEASAAPEAAAAPRPVLSTLAETVATRILVSDARLDGGREVRITLRAEVLPDTEIRLRQEGGRLMVDLVSAHPDSLRLLQAEAPALAARLAAGAAGAGMGPEVVVRVMAAEGAAPGQDGGSQDGNSRDGRSRQTYQPQEEA